MLVCDVHVPALVIGEADQATDYLRCYGIRRWLVALPTTLPRDRFPESKDGFIRFLLAHQQLGGLGTPDGPVPYRGVVGAREFIEREVIGAGWLEWAEDEHGWRLRRTGAGNQALVGTEPPEPVSDDVDTAVEVLLAILALGYEHDEFRHDPRFADGRISIGEAAVWMAQCRVAPEAADEAFGQAMVEGLVESDELTDDEDCDCWLSEDAVRRLRVDAPAIDGSAKEASQRIVHLIAALEAVVENTRSLQLAAGESMLAAAKSLPQEDGQDDADEFHCPSSPAQVAREALLSDHELAARVYDPIRRKIDDADLATSDALRELEGIAWCLEPDLRDESRPTETRIRRTLQKLSGFARHMPEAMLTELDAMGESAQDLIDVLELLNSLSLPSVEHVQREIREWLHQQTDSRRGTKQRIVKPAAAMLKAMETPCTEIKLATQTACSDSAVRKLRDAAFAKAFPQARDWFVFKRSDSRWTLAFIPGYVSAHNPTFSETSGPADPPA